MLDRLDDDIVAISSAPGRGALGIVRVSGPRAIALVDQIAAADGALTLRTFPGARRVSGEVIIDEARSIPATFYLFRPPHSYTRQELVELHTVGSPAVLELLRRRLLSLGARPAAPGEFTARAFLNGSMDLAAAEAVAAVIRAQSDTQLRAARRMMDGTLAGRIAEIRDELAELLALVEADIDFAEEPIEFITPPALRDRLVGVSRALKTLLATSEAIERLDSLPQILLFGAPNAGKSSLMNRLSGVSRAICATAAGTTRDILSAPIQLACGEAILLDTAGVDNSDDEIIAAGRARTVSAAQQVDLVCLVLDLTNPDEDRLFEQVQKLALPRTVIAANKCDLVSAGTAREVVERLRARGIGAVHPVSALCGVGIEDLRAAFTDALDVSSTSVLGESSLLSERQCLAMREAAEAIRRADAIAATAQETIDGADLLAFEMREAMDHLGAVTGDVTTDDLLGRVFANFCIGK